MNFASKFVSVADSDSEDELSVSEGELEDGIVASNMLALPAAAQPAAQNRSAFSFGAPNPAPQGMSFQARTRDPMRQSAAPIPGGAPPPPVPGGGAGGSGFFSGLRNMFGSSARSSAPPPASGPPAQAPAPKGLSALSSAESMQEARSQRLELRAAKRKMRKANKSRSKVVHKVRMDANVVNIDLSVLADPTVRVVPRDAIFCQNPKCKIALSSVDEGCIVYDPIEAAKLVAFPLQPSQGLWTCKFCCFRQQVPISNPGEEAEMLEGTSQDFLLAPPANEGKVHAGNTITILCVDISGSMCVTQAAPGKFKLKGSREDEMQRLNREFGDRSDQWMGGQNRNTTYVSRLQAVQAACDAQLDELAGANPNARVGLVTFAGDVTIIGDGTTEAKTVAGATLDDHATLQQIGSSYAVATPIAQAKANLVKAIWGLSETGPTALGPALITSVAMASQQRGSRVVLCTDGLANVGLGSLEDITTEKVRTKVENWYTGVGNFAAFSGVTVDIVSIVDDGCDLEVLGTVAELSQGNVEQINPLELQKNFKGIMENPVLATNVRATMYLHSALRFRGEDAIRMASSNPKPPPSKPKGKPAPKGKAPSLPEVLEEPPVPPSKPKEKSAPTGNPPDVPDANADSSTSEPAKKKLKVETGPGSVDADISAMHLDSPEPASSEPAPDGELSPKASAAAEPANVPGAAPAADEPSGFDAFEQGADDQKGDDPVPGQPGAEEEDQKTSTPDASTEQELLEVERSAQDVGNVTQETECYFEYGINRNVIKKFGKLQKIPFQVQIHYTKLDGSRMIRIITQQQDATDDKIEVERSVDVGMMGRHFAQKSAQLAQQGNYEASRAVNFSSAHYMDRVAHTETQQRQWGGYMQNQSHWDADIQDEMRSEARSGMNFGSRAEKARSRKAGRSKRDALSSRMYKMKKGKY